MTSLSSRFSPRIATIGAAGLVAILAISAGQHSDWIAVGMGAIALLLLGYTLTQAKQGASSGGSSQDKLKQCVDIVSAAAQGDLEVRILRMQSEDGDIGRLASGVNRLLDLTEAFTKESNTAMEYANQRKYFRRIIPTGLQGSFIYYAETINKSLGLMEQRDIEFTGFVTDNVVPVANTVSEAANKLTTNATTMAELSDDTKKQAVSAAAGTVEVTQNINAVSAAMEEFSASIAEITEQIHSSARVSAEAVTEVERANETVGSLNEAADKIGSVVELINSIAAQTNLLALNATIEAARAGDAGKGFAVVAGEVKALAAQTADATDEIGSQILRIQEVVTQTAEAIRSVGSTVNTIEQASSVVASAIEEQKAATQEIARNLTKVTEAAASVSSAIDSVDSASQQTSESTEGVASSASELSGHATSLNSQVETFLGKMQKVA